MLVPQVHRHIIAAVHRGRVDWRAREPSRQWRAGHHTEFAVQRTGHGLMWGSCKKISIVDQLTNNTWPNWVECMNKWYDTDECSIVALDWIKVIRVARFLGSWSGVTSLKFDHVSISLVKHHANISRSAVQYNTEEKKLLARALRLGTYCSLLYYINRIYMSNQLLPWSHWQCVRGQEGIGNQQIPPSLSPPGFRTTCRSGATTPGLRRRGTWKGWKNGVDKERDRERIDSITFPESCEDENSQEGER